MRFEIYGDLFCNAFKKVPGLVVRVLFRTGWGFFILRRILLEMMAPKLLETCVRRTVSPSATVGDTTFSSHHGIFPLLGEKKKGSVF